MSGKLKKAGKIILIIVISIVILGVVLFCLIKKNFESPLKNIPQESSELPSYVVYGSLYSDYGKIDVSDICEEKGERRYTEEIFCIKNGKAYLMYADYSEDIHRWVLASVDLETSEVQTYCELTDTAESYEMNFSDAYKERNGYYLDGQIVLTDHKKVLTYDIDSQTTQIYAYRDYGFPEYTVYGEYIDNETVRLNMGDSVRTYTLEEMAEKSDSISKIFALKNKKIWCGDSYLYRFFSGDNVHFIGDKVYTVGQCNNRSGEAFAVIFEYNVEEDSWKYVTSHLTGDPVGISDCYVIPSE